MGGWDCRGLPLTTEAPAVAAWDAAVESYVTHAVDALPRIDACLAADPEFALAHVLRGFCLLLLADPRHDAAVYAARQAAIASLAVRGGTAREVEWVAALRQAAEGDSHGAAARLEAVLELHPHDLLALKIAQALIFQAGGSAALLRATGAVAFWSPALPGYGSALGCRAFALEENGLIALAEATGRTALDHAPHDSWARHAVVHACEMTARPADGLVVLAQAAGRPGLFRHHLAWHGALFLLDLGRAEEALARYDAEVWAPGLDGYREVANAASLLWRLESAGVAVGHRWQDVADAVELQAAAPRLGFAEAHAVLALAGAGRATRAAERIARIETTAPTAFLPALTAELTRAILDLRCGRGGAAARRFHGIRARLGALGGSNAQRDVFWRMMIEAALSGGQPDLAAGMMEERDAVYGRTAWEDRMRRRLGPRRQHTGSRRAVAA